MIFAKADSEIIDAEETADHLIVTHGQDIGDHLQMCHQLREHDTQNGISGLRHFQHVASLPDIVAMMLEKEKPEVMRDAKALSKWLKTDEGKLFRVSRDAKPVKGDGLQVIIR